MVNRKQEKDSTIRGQEDETTEDIGRTKSDIIMEIVNSTNIDKLEVDDKAEILDSIDFSKPVSALKKEVEARVEEVLYGYEQKIEGYYEEKEIQQEIDSNISKWNNLETIPLDPNRKNGGLAEGTPVLTREGIEGKVANRLYCKDQNTVAVVYYSQTFGKSLLVFPPVQDVKLINPKDTPLSPEDSDPILAVLAKFNISSGQIERMTEAEGVKIPFLYQPLSPPGSRGNIRSQTFSDGKIEEQTQKSTIKYGWQTRSGEQLIKNATYAITLTDKKSAHHIERSVNKIRIWPSCQADKLEEALNKLF